MPGVSKTRAALTAGAKLVRLPAPLYEALVDLSRNEGRPLAWQVRMLLEESLCRRGLWPPPENGRGVR